MLKVQRLEQIQEELQKHGVLSIEALAEALHVSQSTIRRDLFELEEQGEVLKRIRGGAVRKALNTSHEPSFDVRQDMFLEEKQRIALAAKALVNENETLFLDSGSFYRSAHTAIGARLRILRATACQNDRQP